jgi:RsiW-degrading membrane proteinase PrsW (M82 family)
MADPFLFDPFKVIFTVLVAFIPPIIYTVIVRYSEKYEREAWGSIFQAFLWGGTLAIVLVILIRGFFNFNLEETNEVMASDLQWRTLILMCLITPFFAEIIKPVGLFLVRGDILEAEDGLIYGAVIGLGYTATESLLYGIYLAPVFGLDMFIAVVFMRSMSVMFIQSSTTALTCYGVTRAMKVKHKTGSFWAFPLFLFAAIGIHATFNYIVFMDLFQFGDVDILFSMSSGLLFSIIFAFVLMIFIYTKIYRLDRLDEKPKPDDEEETLTRPEDEPEPMARPRQRPQPPPGPAPRRFAAAPPPPPRGRRTRDPYYDYDLYDQEPYPPPPPRRRSGYSRPPPPRRAARDIDYGPAYDRPPRPRGRAPPPPPPPPARQTEPAPEPKQKPKPPVKPDTKPKPSKKPGKPKIALKSQELPELDEIPVKKAPSKEGLPKKEPHKKAKKSEENEVAEEVDWDM